MHTSPCLDCPHRRVYCHDRCEEYLSFHDDLVAAKQELRKAYTAMEFLIDMYAKRERRARVKK